MFDILVFVEVVGEVGSGCGCARECVVLDGEDEDEVRGGDVCRSAVWWGSEYWIRGDERDSWVQWDGIYFTVRRKKGVEMKQSCGR